MKYLAIDSGLEKTGYAVFERDPKQNEEYLLSSGIIKTDRKSPIESRLLVIHNKIKLILEQYKPDIMILEQLFYFKNQKTFIQVSQAQGSVMLSAAEKNIQIEFLTPLQIKQTVTGYGLSDKKSVHKMLSILLKKDLVVEDDDQSDAIACGLAYCILSKNQLQ